MRRILLLLAGGPGGPAQTIQRAARGRARQCTSLVARRSKRRGEASGGTKAPEQGAGPPPPPPPHPVHGTAPTVVDTAALTTFGRHRNRQSHARRDTSPPRAATDASPIICRSHSCATPPPPRLAVAVVGTAHRHRAAAQAELASRAAAEIVSSGLGKISTMGGMRVGGGC